MNASSRRAPPGRFGQSSVFSVNQKEIVEKSPRREMGSAFFVIPAMPGAIPAVAAPRLHAQNGQGAPEYGNADEADRKAQSQV